MTRNSKKVIGKNGKVTQTREYSYTKDDKKIIIQYHSAGHPEFAGDAAKPHFNVRPSEKPRTGKVPGTEKYYIFKK